MSSLRLPSSPTHHQDSRHPNPQQRHRESTSVSTYSATRRPPPPPPHRRPPPGYLPRGVAPTAGNYSPNTGTAAALAQERTETQLLERARRGVGGGEAATWGQQQHLRQQDAEHRTEQRGRPMYQHRNDHETNDRLDGIEQDLDNEGVGNENEHTEGHEFEQDQIELEDHEQVVPQVPSTPWVLQVVCPTFNHSGDGRDDYNRGHVLRKFHIDSSNMTPSILGDCIAQVSSPTTLHTGRRNIVGLFRSDGVFVSLRDILAFPDASTGHIYKVMTPEEQEDDDDGDIGGSSLLQYILWSLLGIAVAVGSCYVTKELSELIWLFIIESHYLFLELPLQQFYHLGPYWLGGWEGDQLPKICTRITYHGDVEFWTRNYHDCEIIYQKKLHAFMYVAKPMCYLILSLVLFYIVRAIIIAALQRRRQNYQYDQPTREMMETYRAVNTLFRQFTVQQEHQRQNLYTGKH